ncbi:MAG: hypothetical protein EOM20_15485, partial [Spartobacteria bacterium]|nr:hypothetical protein [Spartobacteria bacterium]
LWHCDVIGNAATNNGGGMYHTAAYNCLVAGNSAYQGGGAYDYDYNRQLHNCTVVDNTARDGGGGLYNVYARNTIVQFNHAAQYTNHYTSVFLFSCMAPLEAGDGNIADDPLFVDAAAYDFRLSGVSPCVDTGTNLTSSGYGRDRDGVSRPLDGLNDGVAMWDMGAYEYAHPLADTDGDRMSDVDEVMSKTDATNALSSLAMEQGIWTGDGILVRWSSSPSLLYQVDRSTELTANPAFVHVMTNVAGQAGSTTVTDSTATVRGPYAYRVRTVTNALPDNMAFIPQGPFRMGNAMSPEEGETNERPLHDLYLSSFYVGRHEVTRDEWDQVYNWGVANGYHFNNTGSGKGTNHPVIMIYWYDAVKWCNARSQMEGLTPCYTVDAQVYTNGQYSPDCNWAADGYRLLTEAEWEKAARGGWAELRFPWWGSMNCIDHERANYQSSEGSYSYDVSTTPGYHPAYSNEPMPYTSPVGSFAPNDYGVHDMAGNVAEYCWDWYMQSWYAEAEASAADCRGPTNGASRLYRGGTWADSAMIARCSARGYTGMGQNWNVIGFRVARSGM